MAAYFKFLCLALIVCNAVEGVSNPPPEATTGLWCNGDLFAYHLCQSQLDSVPDMCSIPEWYGVCCDFCDNHDGGIEGVSTLSPGATVCSGNLLPSRVCQSRIDSVPDMCSDPEWYAACCESCDNLDRGTLNSDCDDFKSHTSYGIRDYPSRESVSIWNITVSAGKTVNLFFKSFSVTKDGAYKCRAFCKCDYVEVYDGPVISKSAQMGKRLCGNPGKNRRNFTSTGRHMTVRFTTDKMYADTGFLAQYNAIGSGEDLNILDGSAARCFPGSCGVPAIPPIATRIVGGVQAKPNSWPWMVYLGNSASGSQQWCGGTLIAAQYIMTAAHCTAGESASSLYVTLGAHDIGQGSDTIGVEEIIDHPNYASSTTNNDFSILKLRTPVIFTDEISPVCLAAADAPLPVGDTVFATGWGTVSSGGSSPNELMEVGVTVYSDSRCFSDLGNGYMSPTMMCAGQDGGGKDTCQGDSGGPLVHKDSDTGRYSLVGVTSSGYGCAADGSPGVYARISSVRSWIDGIILA